MNRDEQEDILRCKLEELIEAAREEIERAIAQAERQQHEGESAEQIDTLKAQLVTLDGQRHLVQSGTLSQLITLKATLPSAIGATRQTGHTIATDASFQTGMHVVEMSMEAIHTLQQQHDRASVDFQQYENRSHSRIETLAAANGVDIAGYRMNRARIQAEVEAAKADGNRVGQFQGEAKLAQNNVFGFVLSGGSEAEIEEAKRKAAEARERYLKEKEIEALNAGKAQGLSGDALKSYVDQTRNQAARELDAENTRNAEAAGLTPEQTIRAGLVTTEQNAEIASNENKRVKEGVATDRQTISVASDRVTQDGKIRALAQDAAMNLPTSGRSFKVAQADPDLEDQVKPSTVPDHSSQPELER